MLTVMHTWLANLQDSGLAQWVAQSRGVLAGISGLHIIGFTLVMGSAVIANLRVTGLLLADRSLAEIVRPASRAIAGGVALCLVTGFLLFATRATDAAANGIFRLKLALAVAAVAAHAGLVAPQANPERHPGASAWRGAISLTLWMALAGTSCAYILIE